MLNSPGDPVDWFICWSGNIYIFKYIYIQREKERFILQKKCRINTLSDSFSVVLMPTCAEFQNPFWLLAFTLFVCGRIKESEMISPKTNFLFHLRVQGAYVISSLLQSAKTSDLLLLYIVTCEKTPEA